MPVDLHVAARVNLDVDQAVPAERIQHVVEERQRGRDLALPGAVQVQHHADLGFLRVSFDRGLAHVPQLWRPQVVPSNSCMSSTHVGGALNHEYGGRGTPEVIFRDMSRVSTASFPTVGGLASVLPLAVAMLGCRVYSIGLATDGTADSVGMGSSDSGSVGETTAIDALEGPESISLRPGAIACSD